MSFIDGVLQRWESKGVHERLGLSIAEIRERIPCSVSTEGFGEEGNLPIIVGPWFDGILEVVNVRPETNVDQLEDLFLSESDWAYMAGMFYDGGEFNRMMTIESARVVYPSFSKCCSPVTLRVLLYAIIAGYAPLFKGSFAGVTCAGSMIRIPRSPVVYWRKDGRKTLGDHWPSYGPHEPFLRFPYIRYQS